MIARSALAAPPILGGFAVADFDGDPALEEKINQDPAVTVRRIPIDNQGLCDDEGASGIVPFIGDKNAKRVV